MSVGEKIREEAKRRHQAGETKSLAQLGIWLKAADFADSQQVYTPIETEVLAEALRAFNIRLHDLPVWSDDLPENQRDLWIERAVQVQAEIEKALRRRGS